MQFVPRIGLLTLTLMSVSAVISLRNLPLMAMYGWSSIFFYGLSALLFFIPIALVCAELAAAWPKRGGVYLWVAEAFGPRWGMLAIWLEWIESVVWLPTVLSFIAALIAYIIDPALSDNAYFIFSCMLIVLWTSTFINYLRIETSAWLSAMGVLFGTLIPGVLIIALGFGWALSGEPTHIPLIPDTIIPPLTGNNLVFFTGVLLGFGGIEVAAYHIQEIDNPQKRFPQATFISAAIILLISTLGSLAIALVVPTEDISLSAGVMQAFQAFFDRFNLPWLVPCLAFASLIGALALLNTWIIGPSKGLLASAAQGDLPKLFHRTNANGSPVTILLMQAILGTFLASLFLFMPSVNSSYWILTVLAAQLILAMYFLVFLAVIRLRYTQPLTPRPYRVPGGLIGIWAIAGIGTLACVLAFFIGFFPPADIDVGEPLYYSGILLLGIILFSAPPFVWRLAKKKQMTI